MKPNTRNATCKRQLIGAIDQGTSSTRFLVFENGTGLLVASSQIEIKRIVPKEGWVEIDPVAIMDSVNKTIENVYEQLLLADNTATTTTTTAETNTSKQQISDSIKCIGICNQRESAVVWDSITGKPLYNVIVWMDNRTKDLVDDMIDSAPGRDFNSLKDKTGLPMSTYFSAFKLKWLIDNVQEVKMALKEQRLMFGTVDSWILWNLTGNHLTDVTNASRTFLMDIETLEWDKSLCKHFGVPYKILPKILASADDFGLVKQGPLRGLPITGVIGDQSAALFGHNCLQLGQTKATFGTGCFIMQNIGPGPLHGALKGTQREAKRGLITTVGFKLRDKPAYYALEGSIKIAGAGLTWLRDNLQLIKDYDECDKLVNMTSNSAGVFFVPALGGLYSPYWDPNAAGLYIGLSQFSRREHLVRATFDAIAFQTNDILSLMRGVTHGLKIDGGLCKSDNMCQILADLTGCDILRPSMCETSALGAAMVAGYGAGIWSYEQMLANSNTPHEFSSSSNRTHHYPHESLHYEEKFSSLIQSKHLASPQVCVTNDTAAIDSEPDSIVGGVVARHSDAGGGGGVNDDAGGGATTTITTNTININVTGNYLLENTSNQSVAGSDTEVNTSGEFTATTASSENGDADEEVVRCNEDVDRLMMMPMTLCTDNLTNYYETPSSGYGSGMDNFELSNSGTSTAMDHLRRRDSPISSSQLTNSSSGIEGDAQNGPSSLEISGCHRSEELQLQEQHHHQLIESQHESIKQQETQPQPSERRRSSFIEQTFPSNLSTRLRNYICPPQVINNDQNLDADDDEADRDGDDEEDEGLSFYEDDCDTNQEQQHQQRHHQQQQLDKDKQKQNHTLLGSPTGTPEQITKPIDIFQSYISLEHRTELVDTWRLAVERSMEWTKVHHEEVRKIDYQRLSSLPISMYLFLSLGMVALSGLVTGRGGFSWTK